MSGARPARVDGFNPVSPPIRGTAAAIASSRRPQYVRFEAQGSFGFGAWRSPSWNGTARTALVATNLEVTPPTREELVHLLYEAAELEHTLMCTYLYAAFSLRSGEAEGLSAREAA